MCSTFARVRHIYKWNASEIYIQDNLPKFLLWYKATSITILRVLAGAVPIPLTSATTLQLFIVDAILRPDARRN